MVRYALAQINATVGDLEGNAERILAALRQSHHFSPDLVVLPELALTGYPPEDLLLKPAFHDAYEKVFGELVAQIQGCALIGYPLREGDGRLYNAAAVVADGRVLAVYRKVLLPNYAVFDEKRYFSPGTRGLVLEVAVQGTGVQAIGVQVCEDAWDEAGPARDEAAAGARIIANLSASPFSSRKHARRQETFARLCRELDVWFVYCNLVGGQDGLIFDGGSLVMNPQGEIVAQAKEFEEDLLLVDIPDVPQAERPGIPEGRPVDRCSMGCGQAVAEGERKPIPRRAGQGLSLLERTYSALVLGVRYYVRKNGFSGVVIGLSGGIDSALTAAVAVDALGRENVLGVTMPSRYSSSEARGDVDRLVENLGIRLETFPIESVVEKFRDSLAGVFAALEDDLRDMTDQNLQARVRAVYLMAISNKLGLLVLNTSNKSETAVGYGTLYGDMIGGYGALQDVFKTQVWELSREVNRKHGREVIPTGTINRVPSAELRPEQRDSDSIPEYSLLDPILEMYVEQDCSYDEITAAGHDAAVVRQVIGLVDRNEFKRRQAVPGVRVTPKAFGKDRRLPITNRFRQWHGEAPDE